MNIRRIEGVAITGLSACLPDRTVDSVAALRPLYGDKAENLVKATGIRTRRVAEPGTTSLDLCVAAARRLMDESGLAPEEFGAVIGVSFTQSDRMPCNACQAQARLGLSHDVIAFDVMLACSGWGYGLYVAALLAKETGRKVLLLDGDVQTAFMRKDDAATLPVLADGGTATVVSPDPAAASWRLAFGSFGEKGGALRLPSGGTIEMDGFAVFRFVSMEVSRFIAAFMAETGLDAASVDAFVPHQANVFMIRQLAKLLKIPLEKLWVSCDELGNASSASVPTTLAVVGGREKADRRILFSGFGGGLSVCVGTIGLSADCTLVSFSYGERKGT